MSKAQNLEFLYSIYQIQGCAFTALPCVKLFPYPVYMVNEFRVGYFMVNGDIKFIGQH